MNDQSSGRKCGEVADLPTDANAGAGDPLEAVMAAAFAPVSELERTAAVSEGPGTVIGPYKLMELIGQGGMGLVFVAEQLEPVRRKVALKVLKPGMDSRPVVARFEAERQALALMDHPNIARVLDGGETASRRPFFVMELVKGMPITDYCDQNRLTPRERLTLFIDVCHAVQHAHHKGIIHRDLKPSNILVSSHDGTPVVKVIDFGVAKAIGQQLTDKTLYTHFSQLVGTPLYMSPEQAGQSGLDVDTRTDIYALGVVLYELLTGMTPFDQSRFTEAAHEEIRRILLEEDPPRPSTRVSTLGQEAATGLTASRGSDPKELSDVLRGELDWIVMKCLEKDRNRRFETVNALALDVMRFLNDEQVLACPPSAWYRFSKFARRHKTALASAAAIVMLVVLAFVLLVVSNVVVARQQEETEKALAAATEAKGDLENALRRERRSLYFQRIARADLEWWASNVGRADRLLDECPPEYRHWEWHYLRRLCRSELLAFHGHTQTVHGIAFSPDGQRLASAGYDQVVKIWSLDANKTPITLVGHQQPVASVSFSPDGRRLASAGGDWITGRPGEAKVWDLDTGTELFSLNGHKTAIAEVAFSPDGRLLATAGWDRTVRLWDAGTGKELRTFHHRSSVKCIAFSPDGSRLAAGDWDRLIVVWKAADGEKLATLRGHTASLLGVVFSPDGRQLASASWDHTARIWDVAAARERFVLRGHRETVHRVAFSPDGQQVASASSDGTVRLWNSHSGEELLTLRGHSGIVFDVAFSPGGRCLASASSDRTVKLWDPSSNPQNRSYPWPDATQPRLAISPDGKFLASANRRPLTRKGSVHIRVLETETGRQVLALPEYPGGFYSVAFSPDGKQLVSDWGASARIWDAQTGALLRSFASHAGPVTAVCFAPDSRHLATGSDDHTVKLWDAADAKELATFSGHAAPVTAVAFSPKTSYLASGSKDHTVRIWNWTAEASNASAHILFGHQKPLTDITFSPDGQLVATASEDGTVRVWRVGRQADALVHVLAGNAGAANSVRFSPDGKRLVSAYEDGSVIVWDAATGQEALSMRRQLLRATSVVFSPDGHQLVAGGPPAGGAPHGVIIWDARPDGPDKEVQRRSLLAADSGAARAVRGIRFAEQGQWADAAADFAAALKHEPDDANLWYYLAAAHLGAKDAAAYRKVRAAMLERFGKSTEPNVASHVLYICLALPATAEEAAAFMPMGKAAVPAFAGNERVLGAAFYRNGDHEKALAQFERAAKSFAPRGWDWLFRAMAHQRLGHLDEAQRCLGRALAWIEHADRQAGNGNRNVWISWYESLEAGHLLVEAQALIRDEATLDEGG